MNKKLKTILNLFLIGILISPLSLFAQEYSLDPTIYDEDGFLINQPVFSPDTVEYPIIIDEETVNAKIEQSDVVKGEIASCFNYYTFPSVEVILNTNVNSYNPGESVIIAGKIKNNNKYPIVGLDIKARLVKDIPEPDYSRSEIMILDEFDVVSDISINSENELEVSYTYELPKNAPAGDYQVLFYAVEQDRFNMAGLSFTNDVVASKLLFDVKGDNPDHIYLDQTQITVGDQIHNVMSFVTQHKSGVTIPIKIPLYNPELVDKEVKVTYDLYSWDAANSENKIDTKTETVIVSAQSELFLTYEVDNAELPVYYLRITAQPTDSLEEKTMSNIRFAVRDETKPRINFVGVNTYPLKRGEEATLVTCFHNGSGRADLSNTRIESVLYDKNNKEVSRIEYVGKTIPDIEGIIHKFKPVKDMVSFSVVTKMFDTDGNEIDSFRKEYNCEDIDISFCPVSKPLSPYLIIAIIGIIFGLIVLIYKRKTINLLRV